MRREISPRPLLLIAAGRGAMGPGGGEYGLGRMYAGAASEPVELWGLPEGRHSAAIREQPEEYELRVVGFLDRALLEAIPHERLTDERGIDDREIQA